MRAVIADVFLYPHLMFPDNARICIVLRCVPGEASRTERNLIEEKGDIVVAEFDISGLFLDLYWRGWMIAGIVIQGGCDDNPLQTRNPVYPHGK